MDKVAKFVKEWVIPFSIEILIIVILIKYVFFFAYVPTGSMIPTILEKSWLFATRVHDVDKSIQRGDVVVFNSDEEGITLIKRLVGMPDEHIVIDGSGTVFIDSEPLDEPYVVNHSELSGEYIVPEDCYFFLGDNRSGSKDARYWDEPYIHADKIIGEAQFTLWPFSNFGILE